MQRLESTFARLRAFQMEVVPFLTESYMRAKSNGGGIGCKKDFRALDNTVA